MLLSLFCVVFNNTSYNFPIISKYCMLKFIYFMLENFPFSTGKPGTNQGILKFIFCDNPDIFKSNICDSKLMNTNFCVYQFQWTNYILSLSVYYYNIFDKYVHSVHLNYYNSVKLTTLFSQCRFTNLSKSIPSSLQLWCKQLL